MLSITSSESLLVTSIGKLDKIWWNLVADAVILANTKLDSMILNHLAADTSSKAGAFTERWAATGSAVGGGGSGGGT